MRVLHQSVKEGLIQLRVETLDDLWHLYNLVAPADLVRAVTFRREERETDKIRPDRREKRKVRLGVRVQSLEFQAFADRLRVHGTIEEGPFDLGRGHTLLVGVEDDLAIIKEWKEFHLRRIREAVEATAKPTVTFVSMDYDEAVVGHLRQYGVREAAVIPSRRSGKSYPSEDTRREYFGNILAALRGGELGTAVVVIGPGFARDEFAAFVRERDPALAATMQVHGTNHAGGTGISEALKGGIATKLLEESRVAQESRLMERLLEEIAKEGSYAYGPPEVKQAAERGAIGSLLIGEDFLRTTEGEEVVRSVEQSRGTIMVFSAFHEAGRRLKSLGGVAALTRFKVQ